jgi:hypothetical protein
MSDFQKRHYEAVADLLANIYTRGPRISVDDLIKEFEELFKADNERFDYERFRNHIQKRMYPELRNSGGVRA